ncbi:MAG: hypothetical protein KKG47_15015 [Proteobacteria bacterium]|nr:hypothetical protein [Pseudomonadota bacterium]
MKKLLAWCFVITITVSANLQAEVADLQERVGEYKSVQATRQLSSQEITDLNELVSELKNLQAELGRMAGNE